MAQVVLLRGVNVGGHRVFRPAAFARELSHLGAVNIGAAGTFVIRERVGQAALRAELSRRLPFDTEVAICRDRELLALVARDPFAGEHARRDITCFVSVLVRRAREEPDLPLSVPPRGTWLFRVLEREGPFVLGQYRRQMKAVSGLGMLERLFGVPLTTRNWNTFRSIARVLERDAG